MNSVRTIITVIPGPLATWLSQWYELFEATRIANPHWQQSGNRLGVALAIGIALVVVLFQNLANKGSIAKYAAIALVSTLVLAIICIALYTFLDFPRSRTVAVMVDHVWFAAYLFFLLGFSCSLSLAATGLMKGSGTGRSLGSWARFSWWRK